jgi:aerobic C4-dicarboxylate transport protein
MATANEQTNQRKPFYKQIYFWVLVGIVLGILVGHFFPKTG